MDSSICRKCGKEVTERYCSHCAFDSHAKDGWDWKQWVLCICIILLVIWVIGTIVNNWNTTSQSTPHPTGQTKDTYRQPEHAATMAAQHQLTHVTSDPTQPSGVSKPESTEGIRRRRSDEG